MTKEELCRLEQSELVRLIDDGRLVYLRHKIGDKIFVISCGEITEYEIEKVHIEPENIWYIYDFMYDDCYDYFVEESVGKTVFLTKEQAEQSLKEREQNAN